MSTLREITDGTGFQNGSEPTQSARYWTYRGETVASPGEDDQSYEALNLNRALYVWFEYTGSDVAGARALVNAHFAAVRAADGTPNSSPRTTLTATNNAFRERFAVTNSVSNVGEIGSMQAFPVRGGDTVASTHIVFALVTDLNVTNAAGQRAFFQQNLLSIAEINLSNYIFTTNIGGWEDFNFTLPTTFTSDVNITQLADANQPEPRPLAISSAGKVVLGDNAPVFNGVYTARLQNSHFTVSVGSGFIDTSNWVDVFDTSMSIAGFDWLVGQRGFAFIVDENDPSDFDGTRRLAAITCTGADTTGDGDLTFRVDEIIANPVSAGSQVFIDTTGNNRVVITPFDPRPRLPGDTVDDFVVSGTVSGTDLVLTRNGGGTVTVTGLPDGTALSVTQENGASVMDVSNLVFDDRHFSVTTTAAGDPEVTFNASVLGGAQVEGVNALGNTITASDPATISLRNGLVSAITNPGSSSETITVDAKPRTFVLPGTTSISPELFAVNFIGASTALGNRAMPANPTDGDWFEVSNPFSRGTVTLVTSATTGVHFDGDTSSTEYAITSDIENVRFTYSTKSVDGATQARWITATTTRSPRKYKHTQGTAAIQWDVEHNLNEMHPAITVWDNTGIGEVVIPDQIIAVNANNLTIHFPVAVAGRATMIG